MLGAAKAEPRFARRTPRLVDDRRLGRPGVEEFRGRRRRTGARREGGLRGARTKGERSGGAGQEEGGRRGEDPARTPAEPPLGGPDPVTLQPAGEVLRELSRVRVAVVDPPRHRLEADGLERGEDDRVHLQRGDLGRSLHRIVRRLHHDFHGGLAFEGQAPGQNLVEHDAHRIDVGPPIDGFGAAHLLRAHVGRGSDDPAFRGEGLCDIGPHPLGQAEVRHVRLVPAVDEDVGGLEVPVDDPQFVGVVDGEGDVPEDHDLLPDRDRALPPPLRKGLTLDEFHGDVAPAVDDARFIDRHDVGMFEFRAEARLADEAFLFERLLLPLGVRAREEEFQRHPAVQVVVVGLVDDAHAAASDLRQQRELPEGSQGFGGRGRARRGDRLRGSR
jgi:hypothetical protein